MCGGATGGNPQTPTTALPSAGCPRLHPTSSQHRGTPRPPPHPTEILHLQLPSERRHRSRPPTGASSSPRSSNAKFTQGQICELSSSPAISPKRTSSISKASGPSGGQPLSTPSIQLDGSIWMSEEHGVRDHE